MFQLLQLSSSSVATHKTFKFIPTEWNYKSGNLVILLKIEKDDGSCRKIDLFHLLTS